MLVDTGIMSINEARKKFWNMEASKWGDTWYMPLNVIPVERAGEGTGTTDQGGEGRSRPAGRRIGRPPVDEENLRMFENLSSKTVDRITVPVAKYNNEVDELRQDEKIHLISFDKTKSTFEEASVWLETHEFKTDDLSETEASFCFRQFASSNTNFKEVEVEDGITLSMEEEKSE